MKYVERKQAEGIMVIGGGEIKGEKQYDKKKWHTKRCAQINRRKTRLDIIIIEQKSETKFYKLRKS